MSRKNSFVSEENEDDEKPNVISIPSPDAPNKKNERNITDMLKIFSPGTSMRTALDDIMRAGMGALIVVDKEGLSGIAEGGFRINCKFSAQKLVELAKMDGAIILSSDLKKILYANTLLVPRAGINSRETGTRHKAAERTSKQLKTLVAAVSERRNKITIYYGDENYVLEESEEILRRATETLQILEKQKEIFNDLISHLNVLEITNLVTIGEVSNVLQRIEIIKKVSDIVKRYLIELGREGSIVSMRLKELTKNLEKEGKMILEDYFGHKSQSAEKILNSMNFDFLLDASNISRILFEDLYDRPVSPKGFRILSKTSLLEKDIRNLITNFSNLEDIFNSNRDSFVAALKNEDVVDSLINDLETLRGKIMSGKRI